MYRYFNCMSIINTFSQRTNVNASKYCLPRVRHQMPFIQQKFKSAIKRWFFIKKEQRNIYTN